MDTECVYCDNPDKYGLLAAAPLKFKDKDGKTVTLLMHREKNGVSSSAGIQCKNQNV